MDNFIFDCINKIANKWVNKLTHHTQNQQTARKIYDNKNEKRTYREWMIIKKEEEEKKQ